MTLILDNETGGGGAAGAPADVIKDVDTQSFVAEVIEASMTTPVIVDFWAPWCGPCKQLTPMLEKLVRQAAGAVRLAKVNIDENQALAGQLRVQSVPTVYAFVSGQPVDAFVGAQPESQIKAFIGRLTGGARSPVDEMLDQAREALAGGDAETAAQVYSQVLAEDSVNAAAIAGMIRCFVALGDAGAARQVIDGLDPEVAATEEVRAAASAVELAEQGSDTGDIAGLRAQVAADADDHQARYDLAVALYGAGQTEAAIDELLDIVRRDRTWNEEAARKQLLKVFDTLGTSDPLTVASRKRLSSILFS